KWWPKRVLVNWGPGVRYDFYYDYSGTKTDDKKNVSTAFNFVRNITLTTSVDRNMERFANTNFEKTRYNISGTIYTNRKILISANTNFGDEIRFLANPYLGHTTVFGATITARPTGRLQSLITINTTRFVDTRIDQVDFDVKIVRALTTYQFTKRLHIRNILGTNTLIKT